LLVCLDRSASLGALGFDDVNFISDVHAVGDRFFMAVLADDVLSEKAVGPIVRRSRQAD
jgi:hypothetical protein